MDESFRADADASQSPVPGKPSSSGLTLVLPALAALKQQSGIKKSKYKSTTPDGFGEVKKPPRPVKLKPLKEVLTRLIIQIKKKDDYAFFLSPVNRSQVPEYAEIIKRPMDFGTMTTKAMKGRYRSLEEFTSDVRLVTGNAKLFNAPDSIYYSEADRIEAWALDHIAKAAQTVIEYETDWNIDIEQDLDDPNQVMDNARADEYDQQQHQAGTPADNKERSPSVMSNQGKRGPSLGRRVTRGPYQKKAANTISESIDAEGRLPGSRDGLGVFPPGSDWAELMLALKIKGKRYRTKRERMRIEKEGPPFRDDGSLDYTEMEDPFSILSVFAPELPSQPRLTPLHPPREPHDTSLPTPITLHFPETGFEALSRYTPASHGNRHHWNISRTAPVRIKLKERDEEDGTTGLSQWTRDASTTDWGALAVLEGVLREEMDKRGQSVDGTVQEALFETIRESVDTVGSTALDDTQSYWSSEQIQDAEAYIRDIVYGGIDGAAYVRSLAEFVRRADDDTQTDGPAICGLGMPLARWVEENVVDPLSGGKHALLRDTTRLLRSLPYVPPIADPSSDISSIFQQISLSLNTYPTAAEHLSILREIETHQIDMGVLIRDPGELFESEKEWAGCEWKRRKLQTLGPAGSDVAKGEIKAGEEKKEDDMAYEGADMFMHVLDFSAGVISQLDQRLRSDSHVKPEDRFETAARPSLKRKLKEEEGDVDLKETSQLSRDDEDPLLRNLRLNLLALAKRAPLDKIARLPPDLVPEHIRHYVPTLE